MRLRSRLLQIVVLCVLVSGCVPSACVARGDLELPETPRGDHFGLGFYGFQHDVFVPRGNFLVEGILCPEDRFPGINRVYSECLEAEDITNIAATAVSPKRIRVSFIRRDEDFEVISTRNKVLRIKPNGSFKARLGFPNQFYAAGSSLTILGTPLGGDLPAGMVSDWKFNYTPNGEDPKTLD